MPSVMDLCAPRMCTLTFHQGIPRAYNEFDPLFVFQQHADKCPVMKRDEKIIIGRGT